MLPRATLTRTARESERGKISGRTHEIQRLIGRSLRAVVDMHALGERTVILDCDVLQADGGTRTAAITGACAALALALNRLVKAGTLKQSPLRQLVAATSVGIVDDEVLLDLAYEEDSQADVDMNVVMTEDGGLVEVQATAERQAFPRARMLEMMDYAEAGIRQLFEAQRVCSPESRTWSRTRVRFVNAMSSPHRRVVPRRSALRMSLSWLARRNSETAMVTSRTFYNCTNSKVCRSCWLLYIAAPGDAPESRIRPQHKM